ncbi:MAG: DUF1015 domain-containing protein [Acidobacteria bacterium]|nr:DUF1015 domain-containing protein [Acidobacteriota bacterium]
MATIRPFRALRPTPEAAPRVAAVPYDVVTTAEARALAAGNPLSFLHVSRAEIDLPDGTDPYGGAVYSRAAENLGSLALSAPFVLENEPSLYLYRMRTADGHEQTGVAGCFSLDEYDRGIVKRHEGTRRDKEDDRTRHMVALRAQTGIVFLMYRSDPAIDSLIAKGAADAPLLEAPAPDGVTHTVWRLPADDAAAAVQAFRALPAIYIADGHHRIASAARARTELAEADPMAAAHFFLGVAFPDTATRILHYNRTVADLAGYTPARFVEAIAARLPVADGGPATPVKRHCAMYVGGAWRTIDLGAAVPASGPEAAAPRLDAGLLETEVFAGVMGITDIRNDARVTFAGGRKGIPEALARAVDAGHAAVAFSLAPVTPDELVAVSDYGGVMPPKSTWFDPKLRDGLLIHRI